MNRFLQTKSIVASAATAAVLIGGGATAATAIAATGSGGAGIRSATAARTSQARTADANASCGGIGFTVLHNDRSGGLVLPGGPYRVSSPNLSCQTASAYFTTFLDKYQGPIPGWTGKQLGYGYGTYTNDRTKQTFTVKYVGAR